MLLRLSHESILGSGFVIAMNNKKFLIRKIKSYFEIEKNDVIFTIGIAFIICLIDLFTKHIVFSSQEEYIYVCPLLNILKVRNYGVSFGLFSNGAKTTTCIILILDIIITVYLFHTLKRKYDYSHPFLFKTSIALPIGGALGNFFDRLYYGSVRDFIDVHLNDYHWPCFNVADVSVCVGLALLIICELFCNNNFCNNNHRISSR